MDTIVNELHNLLNQSPAQTVAHAGVVLPDISEQAISKKLASDPGASIFDVAGTHLSGPSSNYSPQLNEGAEFPQSVFDSIPREGGVLSTPLRASVLGRSENLVHGTRVSGNWETPSLGGRADIGTENDALKLPDDELGVHFGNPKQANVFSGSWLASSAQPRQYPVVVQANNPLRLPDSGTWRAEDVVRSLRRATTTNPATGNNLPMFPSEELDGLDSIGDVRDYIKSKGYDSVVYRNKSEDPGHDSFIKFTPSPVAPDFVSGVRSPWAKFDPNKLSWPELAAGVPMAAGASGAATGLLFDQNNNPIVQTK